MPVKDDLQAKVEMNPNQQYANEVHLTYYTS